MTTPLKTAAATAITASMLAASACAPSARQATAPTTGSTSTAPAVSPQSGTSDGQTYTVTIHSADGRTPDGHGQWHTHTGQLTGGDPSVAHAFNDASNASVEGQLNQARGGDHRDWPGWEFTVTPTVTFRPPTISQLLVGVYYARDAAHPLDFVSTVVIDSRTAQPITLHSLFRDETIGLQHLSEQAKRNPQTSFGPGSKPREENFANWIPTAAGMEIHFADYQFGHGLPVLTVPWPALTDLLAPDMIALTHA